MNKGIGKVIVIGAGPAGLTAAYLLSRKGVPVTVLEADPTYVGGISRTVNYKGFRFDIGGHRFFSKSREVESLWTELLPDDMLDRPRSSRIFYRGKFFSYPLKPFEALFKLGVFESIHCVFSYGWARIFPVKAPKSFQEWVTNKFGARLFSIFFKSYTEKVWGMSCTEISADWAAQRIKGLSLLSAVVSAFKPKGKSGGAKRTEVIKTLIDSFRYPRKGPGMMWEACSAKVTAAGGKVVLDRKVLSVAYDEAKGEWTVTSQDLAGGVHLEKGASVISTMPMRELAGSLRPGVSSEAAKAGSSLKYRDFLTVALIVRDREAFTDNWLYIHEPNVKVGRIQNFRSWSPELIPDTEHNCYGLEYFCFEGDGLWNTSDQGLIELAKREMVQLGLTDASKVVDGHVVRQPKAYPVYDGTYQAHVQRLSGELEAKFPTLHLIGRNGMHKYNNQDHAMMTAMLCVKNILAGARAYDLWAVNEDAEYHEAGKAGDEVLSTQLRAVPRSIADTEADKSIAA